jgi:hypothetical protein
LRQALRKELDAVAAGGDLDTLAAGDGGLSAGTFGANHDASNEVGPSCMRQLLLCRVSQAAITSVLTYAESQCTGPARNWGKLLQAHTPTLP